MARISPRIVNKTTEWTANTRPRVGQTIRYNGYDWINVTGKNSEPGVSGDWLNIGIAIVVEPFFVGDTNNEGFATNDTHAVSYSLKKDWSKFQSIVTPADFDPLTQL